MREELKIISKNEGKKEDSNENINNLSESTFHEIEIKEDNFIKKRVKKYYNNTKFIIIILFLLSYLLYFLSLEKCLSGIDGCPIKVKWMILKIIELINLIILS